MPVAFDAAKKCGDTDAFGRVCVVDDAGHEAFDEGAGGVFLGDVDGLYLPPLADHDQGFCEQTTIDVDRLGVLTKELIDDLCRFGFVTLGRGFGEPENEGFVEREGFGDG